VAQLNQPVIQKFSSAYRKIADEYEGDRFLMGEVDGDEGNAMNVSKTFSEPGRLHATYNFDLLEWSGLTVLELKEAISKAIEVFNGSGRLCFAFSNHDVPRSATRQLEPLGISVNKQDDLQLLLLQLETSLIGSTCVYQGEELGLGDVIDIPVNKMKDPWGINFYPEFLGRDTCRTPMVWDKKQSMGGFTSANQSWLPIAKAHLGKAGLDMANNNKSIYSKFSKFLKWRKKQPAMMQANIMSEVSGGSREIIFDRVSKYQNLRCKFDFEMVKATFEEVKYGTS
jgi:alpha-glucosidase